MQLSLLPIFSAACFSIVFSVSAQSKGRDVLAFALSIRQIVRISLVWANPLARIIIVGEIAVVTFAIIEATRSIALAFAVVLLSSFTLVLIRGWRSGEAISCQCFGRSSIPVRWHHLVRNAILMVIAAAGIPGSYSTEGRTTGSVVVAIIFGVAIGIAITLWDDLVEIVSPSPASSSDKSSRLRSIT